MRFLESLFAVTGRNHIRNENIRLRFREDMSSIIHEIGKWHQKRQEHVQPVRTGRLPRSPMEY
jgi:hypothetical protein